MDIILGIVLLAAAGFAGYCAGRQAEASRSNKAPFHRRMRRRR